MFMLERKIRWKGRENDETVKRNSETDGAVNRGREIRVGESGICQGINNIIKKKDKTNPGNCLYGR